MEKEFKVGDFKNLILQESSEFKAVLGTNVESEDKKNNGKAYDDAKKRAKNYDGGLAKEVESHPKYNKEDGNKTLLDYNPENVSKEWKDRVYAQVKGYSSEAEMNNGLEKNGEFGNNENIYQGIKNCGKKIHQNEKDFKKTGLQAREMPAETFDKEEMYESRDGFDMRNLINTFKANEKKSVVSESPMKTVYFKKTTFLSEGHMISRIPDEFKNEGSQFKMKDKTGNEYLVEWNNNSAKILGHSNTSGLNESLSRMGSLVNYSTSDSKTTNAYRLNENEDAFKEMLDKVRKIM